MVVQRWSVIIPVWNGRAFLPECLDALAAQAGSAPEIIAVDNGSTDGSAELIATRYPHVRLLRNTQNLGFGRACNMGMQAATGDALALLNQDTRTEPGWLLALQAALSSDAVGVVGSKILSAADRSLQHAGGRIHDVLGTPFHLGKADPDAAQWDAPREVEYVTGAALALRRQVIDAIGGFDERFFPAYYEDADLCFRARAAGFTVLYWPQAIVLHHESTSTPAATRWFYFQRGRIRFVLKHWPFERLVGEFPAAEANFQATFANDFGTTRPLRLAYIAARSEAAAIAGQRWPGEAARLAQINARLRQLHAQALTTDFARLYPGQRLMAPEAARAQPVAEPTRSAPPLTEFEFRSTAPVLGGLVTAIRRAWYAMAARWAVQHLTRQQQAINQSLTNALQQLERQTAMLAAQQDALQRQLSAGETDAATAYRFLLDQVVQAEEEALFALLWPLRWDLVLEPDTCSEEAV